MPSQRFFARYGSSENLSQLALDLLEQQKAAWPQLHGNYRALENVRTRALQCHGYAVRLQFNPQRLASSGAKVDAQSIQARPCFLCLQNLPAPQQGILYREEFLVLCNPAPIFTHHYTVSHLRHRPQAIAEHLEIFLKLARDFSPHFSVFYNGPQCGASAPDHVHFQACPRGAIPVETQIHEAARRLLVKNVLGISVHQIEKMGRKILLLTGFDEEAMTLGVLRVFSAMKEARHSSAEPMLNAIGFYRDELYHLLLFPRQRHRPGVYFREGEERVLISPAAVDMGGLIITPVEKDFLQTEAELVADIYREVSISSETMRRIISLI